MKSTMRVCLIALPLLFCCAALLVIPDVTTQAAREGLRLCARVLVPSLFPFFVCAKLIVSLRASEPLERLLAPVMQRLFGTGASGSEAFVLGLIGGYPTGAQVTKNLYDAHRITKDEARQLVLFCNNAGPAFIFGVVGNGLFSSLKLGILLYGMQALSAVLTGILLRKPVQSQQAPAGKTEDTSAPPFAQAFVESVRQSGAAVLNVCMFVTIFSVLSGILQTLTKGLLPDFVFALLSGALELTGGVAALGACALPVSLKLASASFLLAFSGLSICAQTAAVLSEDRLFPRGYLFARLLQGLIAAALTMALAALLRVDTSAVQASAQPVSHMMPVLFSLIWLSCGIICLICRKVSYGKKAHHRV